MEPIAKRQEFVSKKSVTRVLQQTAEFTIEVADSGRAVPVHIAARRMEQTVETATSREVILQSPPLDLDLTPLPRGREVHPTEIQGHAEIEAKPALLVRLVEAINASTGRWVCQVCRLPYQPGARVNDRAHGVCGSRHDRVWVSSDGGRR